MSQVATSFSDSTYSASNKPSTTTLKADIQALETAHNDTDTNAATLTGSQTLTNKILTSPVVNTQITGTAIVDEDNMASDSAVKVPTQQSVKAYVLAIASQLNPIGTIREFTVSTNPGTLLGFGTWTAFGTGRVTIGIDSGDTDFDTAEETGGAKTKTIAASNLPELTVTVTDPGHVHAMGITDGDQDGSGSNGAISGTKNTASATTGISAVANPGGANTAISIVNPYIVVYRWKRTA